MTQKTKILFICTGNICRSPLAHRLFEKLADERGVGHRFEAESAGTGSWHVGQNADPRMRETARQRGWELSHYANHLTRQDMVYYDHLIVMDESHYAHCKRLAEENDIKKIKYLREFDPLKDNDMNVPDPYYGEQEGFDLVYDICERSCGTFLDRLLES